MAWLKVHKELKPEEAKAHTLRYMAVLKRHGLVATAEDVAADKGRSRGGSRSKPPAPPVTAGHKGSAEGSKPTATQKTATDLGVKRETVSRRVSEAAKDAPNTAQAAFSQDGSDPLAFVISRNLRRRNCEYAERR